MLCVGWIRKCYPETVPTPRYLGWAFYPSQGVLPLLPTVEHDSHKHLFLTDIGSACDVILKSLPADQSEVWKIPLVRMNETDEGKGMQGWVVIYAVPLEFSKDEGRGTVSAPQCGAG